MSASKNLQGKEGVEKLKELVKEINICLFCTQLKTSDGATCRPMSAQEVDDEGNLWFFSAIDSDKNKEIMQDKNVQLVFSSPQKGSYLIVNGEAEIIADRSMIEDLWSPIVKIWFKEGKHDPKISIVKVKTNNAYYWDTAGNRMVGFFKLIASVATGKTFVDSVQGVIEV